MSFQHHYVDGELNEVENDGCSKGRKQSAIPGVVQRKISILMKNHE